MFYFRYFTIVSSPNRRLFRCSVTTSLILIWLISFLSMLPLVIFQQVETVKLGELVLYEVCLEKWPSSKYQKIYTLTLTTSQFIIPVIVLITIHFKISLYLKVHLNGPPRLGKRGKLKLTFIFSFYLKHRSDFNYKGKFSHTYNYYIL